MNLVSFDYLNASAICNSAVKECRIYKTYHPEGVIRPTPSNADNETDFVFDYFIKDYLGNVRVVVTEENAVFTQKFLTTLEEAHRAIEEENFDNVGETADDLPLGYPVNGSVALNEKIALLSTANGTEIGPSIVMPVKRGDKVSLKTDYFYTEDAPGASYGNLDMLVNEVLLALAASGSGILRLSESQLMDIASGTAGYNDVVASFFSNSFDTTDVSRPHAYLVWMMYDNNMNLIEQGSGVRRVTNPNSLEQLLRDEIPIAADGYLHAYVSNGSVPHVSFDNFMLTYLRGNTRQINHYYPYGLSIDGLDHSDEYLNKYTSKELQTGEFSVYGTSGLEMFDFGARFYDPQIGRWTTPDPAEQFANPYLAMGNNPVMYVDPDGEWVNFVIGAIVGGIQGYTMGNQLGLTGWDLFATTIAGAGVGTLTAGVGSSVAASSGTVVGAIAGGAVAGAGNSVIGGLATDQNIGQIAEGAIVGGFKGAATGLVGGAVGASIGGGTGAFFGGASAGAFGTAINGGSGNDIWKGAALGGVSSFGLYHLSGVVGYKQYQNSGETFEGRQLSYRQFMGIQADFQRSRFWKREHGGQLLTNGRIDRSAVVERGKDYITWDPSKIDQDAFADYHIHHGKSGLPAPNGGVWMSDHSPLDLQYRTDRNYIGSIVANRIDTYYRPPGIFDRSGLINYNTNFNNPLVFPFFGW